MRGFWCVGATPAGNRGVAATELVVMAGELAGAAELVGEASVWESAVCAGSGRNAKPQMAKNMPAAEDFRAFTGHSSNTGVKRTIWGIYPLTRGYSQPTGSKPR